MSSTSGREGDAVTSNADEEREFMDAFITPNKKDRIIELISKPKGRAKFVLGLAHFHDLDSRRTLSIPSSQHSAAAIEKLLRSRGAGDICYLISEDPELDCRRLPLDEALRRVVGYGMGTLVSCIQGRLGFYEGEGPSDRYILAKD